MGQKLSSGCGTGNKRQQITHVNAALRRRCNLNRKLIIGRNHDCDQGERRN
jgi:hypothetical protein